MVCLYNVKVHLYMVSIQAQGLLLQYFFINDVSILSLLHVLVFNFVSLFYQLLGT